MVCSAVSVPLRPSHPTPKELLGNDTSFGVTFVRCAFTQLAMHCKFDIPSLLWIVAIVGHDRAHQIRQIMHNVEL